MAGKATITDKSTGLVETVDFVQFDGTNYDELKTLCGEHFSTTKKEWEQGFQLFVGNCYPHSCCFFNDIRKNDYVIRYKDNTFQVLSKASFKKECEIACG